MQSRNQLAKFYLVTNLPVLSTTPSPPTVSGSDKAMYMFTPENSVLDTGKALTMSQVARIQSWNNVVTNIHTIAHKILPFLHLDAMTSPGNLWHVLKSNVQAESEWSLNHLTVTLQWVTIKRWQKH